MSSSQAPLQDNYLATRSPGESLRLSTQHASLISCQGYHLSPSIPIPCSTATPPSFRIADIATGSAIFLLDLASSPAFSSSAAVAATELHGFDISPSMFPSSSHLLPANLSLHVADARKPFEEKWWGYFDVVHIRLLGPALRREEWEKVLRNVVAILKPGGWLQWVEGDAAHGMRRAVRDAAPVGAAEQWLTRNGSDREDRGGKGLFVPPRMKMIDRYSRVLMDDERVEAMNYGYMNLDVLMADPAVGGLECIDCDTYVLDRGDDGGKFRREWAVLSIDSVSSMLKARQEKGDPVADVTREELARGFEEDVANGGYFLVRAAIFTGRKKR